MFERFTSEAREVVERAQEEARGLGAQAIGAEHLLLGVARGRPSAAASALASLGLDHHTLRAGLARSDADALAAIGIDLDEVRRRVDEAFGPGALGGGRTGRLRFTPDAKKALELALREALVLGDRHIGSEHILLGIMQAPGDRVTAVLKRHGQEPQAVRAATLAALRDAA